MVPAPPDAAPFATTDLAIRMISDVQEVFSTMVGRDDLLHLPHQPGPVTHIEDCITAMVGLAGTYNGVVSLHAPRSLALDFASGMLGITATELVDEVHDAMGELANMIAGAFKHHLSCGGADIRISIPSIITDNEYVIAANRPDDALSLGFSADQQWFLVSAVLERE